jgi:hypothetical protein
VFSSAQLDARQLGQLALALDSTFQSLQQRSTNMNRPIGEKRLRQMCQRMLNNVRVGPRIRVSLVCGIS